MPEIEDYSDAPAEHMQTAERMGLSHPLEGLLCAPDRYEDYRDIYTNFGDIPSSAEHEPVVFTVKFQQGKDGNPSATGYVRNSKVPLQSPWIKQCFRLNMDVQDGQGKDAVITFFGSAFRMKEVPVNVPLMFLGKAKWFGGTLYLSEAKPALGHKLGAISPIYLGEQGKKVSGEDVQAMIDWIMQDNDRAIYAVQLAAEVIVENCAGMNEQDILRLCTPHDSIIVPKSLIEWLGHLHNPIQSTQEGDAAREIAVRICALSMQCMANAENMREPCDSAPIGLGTDLKAKATQLIDRIEINQGFGLTQNQKDVALSVIDKLQSKRPLNGLLNGEVGSGKTLAYAVPAIVAHKQGARVAIMAPTELLADQIAKGIAEKGGMGTTVERVETGKKIRNPNAILVGTKGLVTVAKKIDYMPNFLICDEQQKMDTEMREALIGPHTHTLDVSATPIPRSLALSLYEGVDVYTLNEQPVKRDIQTILIDVKERGLATRAIKNAINAGQRAAVVFTLVDGGKQAEKQAQENASDASKADGETVRALAISSAEAFDKHFPGKVSLLHGKLKGKDSKKEALDSFRSGEKPLMVTTTIFETGIDVPDVSILVIRDAQHLGMSQLHQLRGRLARNGGKAQCFLLVDDVKKLSDESYERLSLFTQTQDGYTLATQDMLARGTGDLGGSQQNGRASTLIKGIKLKARDLLVTQADTHNEGQQAQHQQDAPQAKQMGGFRKSTGRPGQQRLFG